MVFDIRPNTNKEVFWQLIRAVGAGRILFGSGFLFCMQAKQHIDEIVP